MGLIIGRLIPVVVVRLDGTAPRVNWGAALALLLGAGVVGGLAWNTWQSLHKKHQRMTSEHGVTMLALAKASAAVGALFAGVYGGFALAFVNSTDSPLGRERVFHAGGAAIAGLLLMVAGLLLERALRVPGDDNEGKGGKGKPVPDGTPA
ncbi:MAG: hypothetical protein JWQ70_1921 [Aeromicrobium sp.]|nr:hypothetical protein [Aeromicrobium sp.]